MFKKLAVLVNHPYAAPLTEAVKGIARIAYAPVSGFFEDVKKGWDNADEGASRLMGLYQGMYDGYNDSTGPIGFFGAAIGAIGLAIAGGVTVATGGGGIAGIIGGAVAGIGFGAAVGPFALAAVIGIAAAAVGSVIGGVPGFIHGVTKLIEYRKNSAVYDQALQMMAQANDQDDAAKRISPVLSRFNALSADDRNVFVRAMNDAHADAVYGRSEKIMKSVEALPDYEKKALAKKLKESLKDEFADVSLATPPAPEPAPEPDDDGVIVAPRTASFSRRGKRAAGSVHG